MRVDIIIAVDNRLRCSSFDNGMLEERTRCEAEEEKVEEGNGGRVRRLWGDEG